MKRPKEGADGLPKDGSDWITLKVIVQGSNGQKMVKFWYFVTFWQFSQNWSENFFFIFCMQLLGDDIDQLSRDEFDWIIQKVIFNVTNVRFVPFSHN